MQAIESKTKKLAVETCERELSEFGYNKFIDVDFTIKQMRKINGDDKKQFNLSLNKIKVNIPNTL